MNKQSLQELRDKVAAGDAWRFDPLFEFALYRLKNDMNIVYLANDANLAQDRSEGSLDAAVAFLEAVLPDWDWEVSSGPEAIVKDMGAKEPVTIYEAEADTPARALLLATLDALIERAE